MKKCFYSGKIKDTVNDKVIEIKNAWASYDDEYKNRYSLTVELLYKNKKELTVIMFNPSEKGIKETDKEKRKKSLKENPLDLTDGGRKKTFVDGTITNVICIANKCNYSKIIILNLFSVINSTKNEIEDNPKNYVNTDNNNENDCVIKKYLNKEYDVLIAWGETKKQKIKEKMDYWTKKIKKDRQKCFAFNKDGSPTHPSPYNRKRVYEFLQKCSELKTIPDINSL